MNPQSGVASSPNPNNEQKVRRRKSKVVSEKKIEDDEFMAAAIGDVQWLEQSLKDSGAAVKYDKNGFAAIHLAAIHGHLDCLELCIEKFKTDINLPSSTGWRAIHLCISNQARKRSLECLAYLLEKGADCSVSNDDGVTPVHQAASEGNVDCLKMLLEANAKFDIQDCRGNTPLNLAKLWGHRKCARILAAGVWNQDKEFIAKEMHQLNKVKMQQVLREFEEEEKKKETRQFLRNAAFTQWAENKNCVQKPQEDSEEQNMKVKEYAYKTNNIFKAAKDNKSNENTKIKLHINVRKPSDEIYNLPDEKSHDKLFCRHPSKSEEKSDSKKSVKLKKTYVTFKSDWNKSTKAMHSQYISILHDDYPRDEYTMMPQVKGIPRFFEGKFVYPFTPDKVDGSIIMKSSASKLRMPQLPKELIDYELSTHSSSNDRGMVFKCKHIDDIHMKKKFDLDIKGRSEAALHLTNDVNSFLVQNSVRVGRHMHPKYYTCQKNVA